MRRRKARKARLRTVRCVRCGAIARTALGEPWCPSCRAPMVRSRATFRPDDERAEAVTPLEALWSRPA